MHKKNPTRQLQVKLFPFSLANSEQRMESELNSLTWAFLNEVVDMDACSSAPSVKHDPIETSAAVGAMSNGGQNLFNVCPKTHSIAHITLGLWTSHQEPQKEQMQHMSHALGNPSANSLSREAFRKQRNKKEVKHSGCSAAL